MKKFITFLLLICLYFSLTPNICFAEQEVVLPIIMYHTILNSRQGTYIVSERQLSSDLEALHDEGYTSVFPSEVIDYVYGKGKLPKKPVLITFDDGYYNNLYYGLPILQKQGFKANINIIGKITDDESENGEKPNPNYSYLSWEEVKILKDSGNFEIGHHTYDMHKYEPRYGIGQLWNESDEDYKKSLESDTEKLLLKMEEKAHIMTSVFAYPFGKYNELSKNILTSMNFKMLLTCTEKVNIIQKNNPSCLLNLGRFNRRGDYSTSQLLQKIKG